MVADFGLDAGGFSTALDHTVGIRLGEGSAGELFGAAAHGAEQRSLGIIDDPGLINICRQVGLKIMMTGHGVGFAAFFTQAEPEPAAFHVDVFDPQSDRGADAGEGVNHQSDQGRYEHGWPV